MNMTAIFVWMWFVRFPLALQNICEWILMSWIDTRREVRHNLVNTGKPQSVDRHLYLHLHSHDVTAIRRGAERLLYLRAIVWSVAFILIQEGGVLSLSLFHSWLLWRRLPQRFASADSSRSSIWAELCKAKPYYTRYITCWKCTDQFLSFLRLHKWTATTQKKCSKKKSPSQFSTKSTLTHTRPVVYLLLVQHLLEHCFVAVIFLPPNPHPPSCWHLPILCFVACFISTFLLRGQTAPLQLTNLVIFCSHFQLSLLFLLPPANIIRHEGNSSLLCLC